MKNPTQYVIQYRHGGREIVEIWPLYSNSTATRNEDDAQTRPTVDFGEGTMPDPAGDIGMTEMPTADARRLPQVGDIWRTRSNALVAILKQASVLDGGFDTISLTKGDTAIHPGRPMLHDLDGKLYGGSKGEPRPFDLAAFVTRFDS